MKTILFLILVTLPLLADDTLFYGSKPFMIMGNERDLLLSKDTEKMLNGSRLDYFPDEGTSRMPSKAGSLSLLVSGGISTWLLEGGDPVTFTSFTKIAEVFKPVDTSSWENGYAGMSGVWVNSKGKVWGFYHAEDHFNLPNIPGTTIPGFYASVGVAVSLDSGKTWRNRKRLLAAAQSKITGASAPADQGVSEPGVVSSPDGKFVYIVYTDHSRLDGAPVRLCIARIPIYMDTLKLSSCNKWDGSTFCLPCSTGADIPVLSGKGVMGKLGDALEGHPVWCEKLKRYLMPLGTYDYTSTGVGMGGMWIVSSEDLINWTTPVRLTNDWALPFSGKSMRWESSIIWTNEKSASGWLVYGKTNRFPDTNFVGEGAHMVGRTFRIIYETDDYPVSSLKATTSNVKFAAQQLIFDLRGRAIPKVTSDGIYIAVPQQQSSKSASPLNFMYGNRKILRNGVKLSK